MSPRLKGSHLSGTTPAAVESFAMPLVGEQELVFLADIRCSKCQKRITKIFSKMNKEIQTLEFSILEKKLKLACTYPVAADKLSIQRATASKRSGSLSTASFVAQRLFGSFSGRKKAIKL